MQSCHSGFKPFSISFWPSDRHLPPPPHFPFHAISTPLNSPSSPKVSCLDPLTLVCPSASSPLSPCLWAYSSSSFGSCLDFGLQFLQEGVPCPRWIGWCLSVHLVIHLRDSPSVTCAAVYRTCPLHLARCPTHSKCHDENPEGTPDH